MEQFVYKLQQMVFDKNVDIEEFLRKVYLIAVSTNQKDIEEWVFNEQNGYKCVDNLPEYKFLKNKLRIYNFWGDFIQLSKQEQGETFSKLSFS